MSQPPTRRSQWTGLPGRHAISALCQISAQGQQFEQLGGDSMPDSVPVLEASGAGTASRYDCVEPPPDHLLHAWLGEPPLSGVAAGRGESSAAAVGELRPIAGRDVQVR